MTARGPVTLRDVAERAGVSSATASRALAGSTRPMDAQLRQRVLDAAADLRYVSDGPARALARKQTSLVGLVVHDVNDPYYSAIASGAMQVARDHGLLMMMASAYRDIGLQTEYVARLRAQRARAVLLAGGLEGSGEAGLVDEVRDFVAQGGRVVAIAADGLDVDTVAVPNEEGGRRVARHLHAAGHRHIGVVAGPPELQSARQRLTGFVQELASLGVEVPPEHVVPGDFTRVGGRWATLELADRAPVLTAVFALNDSMALGALAALRDLGRSVPGEISVVGFDDTPVAEDVTPALTTVHLPLIDMGRLAMELALDLSEDGPRRSEVDIDLVQRASTGPAATT